MTANPNILAVLRGTELETVAICAVCMLLASLMSLALERAKRCDKKARELDGLGVETDTRDFCDDLSDDDSYMADVGADSVPPLQAYKPPLTDVLS